MTVDERIHNRIRRAGDSLPEPDTASALEAVLDRAESARRRRGSLAGLAAAALAFAVLAGGPLLDRVDGEGGQVPPHPADPSPDEQVAGGDERLTRPRATTALGVEQLLGPFGAEGTLRTYRWGSSADRGDGSFIWRVRLLESGRPGGYDLTLDLDDVPPGPRLNPGRDVEYGIVLDLDGDRVADCELGITTHTAVAGQFRAWTTRLADARLDEQVGPPYGFPFEFAHPFESGGPTMEFLFGGLGSECGSLVHARYFYTWAAALEDGEVVDVDYAPDATWLELPDATWPELE